MTITFYSQSPFSLGFGGLEVQILNTATALERQGVKVEFLDYWAKSLPSKNVHVFGSGFNLFETIQRMQVKQCNIILSAIFLKTYPSVVYKAQNLLSPLFTNKFTNTIRKNLFTIPKRVIAITKEECKYLHEFYSVPYDKIDLVFNGTDARFYDAKPDLFVKEYGLKDFIFCVGKIELRKNQLSLLRAFENEPNVPVVLLGAPDDKDPAYTNAVQELVDKHQHFHWIRFIPYDSEMLTSAFAAAKMHILPSFSEGHGLVSVEAYAAGKPIVMSNTAVMKEAFGDFATYCNPKSLQSIRSTCLEVFHNPEKYYSKTKPEWLISWDDVAKQLITIYETSGLI
jgi:glycosyltransferase involved in cell wall biosynthesis